MLIDFKKAAYSEYGHLRGLLLRPTLRLLLCSAGFANTSSSIEFHVDLNPALIIHHGWFLPSGRQVNSISKAIYSFVFTCAHSAK